MMESLRRLAYLWNRRRLEREMLEEMAYHRELMADDRRTSFGDDLRLREDAREMWGWTWLDRLHQDLAYGVRVLRNAPGFTLTAMLILVLGIGVPLSAFRVVLTDLEGASVPDPDSLDLARRLQETARGLDARLQPTVHVVSDAYEREVGKASAALAVIGLLGTVATLLSIVGLGGLAGYTVAQRTREIGLRIAPGARPRHLVGAILAPGRRATRIDPAQVLQHE